MNWQSITFILVAFVVAIWFRFGCWRPSVKGISVPSLGGSWIRYILAGLGVLGVGLLVKHFYPEKFWLFIIMVVVTAVIIFWTQVWKMIMALIGLGVFFLLLGMGSCSIDCGTGLKGMMDKSASSTTTQDGREKRIYRFSDFPNSEIVVEIKLGEVDFYPKGGEIEITPPSPAKPWRDKPGTAMPRVERPPGIYKIKGVSPDAWGVDIWN